MEEQSWYFAKGKWRIYRYESQLCCDRTGARTQAAGRTFRHPRAYLSARCKPVSGAGYPGVASLDILGNVFPSSAMKRKNCRKRPASLLGMLNGKTVTPLDARISAHCNRVAVEDGHLENVSIELRTKATRAEILTAWRSSSHCVATICPRHRNFQWSSTAAEDRPQPRLDRMRGRGMAAVVGRLRPCRCWIGSSPCCRTTPFVELRVLRCLMPSCWRHKTSWRQKQYRWRQHPVCGHEDCRHEIRGHFGGRCRSDSAYGCHCCWKACARIAAGGGRQRDVQGDGSAAGRC